MIGDKNVSFAFIMRHFIYFFVPDRYQEKPTVCPDTAKLQNHISSPDPSKKAGDDGKRKYHQHDSNKSKQGIDAIEPLQRLQQ